jgi:hypothetical protein
MCRPRNHYKVLREEIKYHIDRWLTHPWREVREGEALGLVRLQFTIADMSLMLVRSTESLPIVQRELDALRKLLEQIDRAGPYPNWMYAAFIKYRLSGWKTVPPPPPGFIRVH